jgi:hypothetical protein
VEKKIIIIEGVDVLMWQKFLILGVGGGTYYRFQINCTFLPKSEIFTCPM